MSDTFLLSGLYDIQYLIQDFKVLFDLFDWAIVVTPLIKGCT
jgi:hypothetical protein